MQHAKDKPLVKNTLFWSTAFLSLLQGVWAGVPGIPGATNAVPGMATNTPPTMVPERYPGGVGIIPYPYREWFKRSTRIAPTNAVPGGVQERSPVEVFHSAPAINPGTGIPILAAGFPALRAQRFHQRASSANPVNRYSRSHSEAMRVYLQGARDIREEAESGMMRQQHNLAALYGLGLRVPLDHQKAFEWYKKAADEGLPESIQRGHTKMEWVHAKIW